MGPLLKVYRFRWLVSERVAARSARSCGHECGG
ncbi:hypothetical protein STVIR_4121 [Streptomyces viridochromogenes Tue57]|uniref:Uncharacterized protein n=1 Tax=Streptomyces viridochromogenes Tue57 TaxID=1160705 RepID=L8PEV7_STRVR|nr:hypothetical protein STVIR_4121 [Streptomyces viridochromogenes Tue57]